MPDYQNGTQYELWLAEHNGTRLAIMDLAGYFSFTRALNNIGFFSIVLPVGFDAGLLAKDRRVYFWRKPVGGVLNIAFEGFIRNIITESDREGGIVRIIQGPGLNYLLSGRYAAYPEANTNVDTTVTPVAADDLLKAVVRTNLGATATTANGRKASGVIDAAYFGVAADLTLGPTLSMAFSYRNVLEVCREICDASRTAGTELYFEIVPATEDGDTHTMEFRTYIGQPGRDRTSDSADGGKTFGPDFSNMAEPKLVENATDEINRAFALGQGQDSAREIQTSEDVTRQGASPFALREGIVWAMAATTAAAVLDAADAAVVAGRPRAILTGKLISMPGYIYGLDVDFGDRVTVSFDGRQGDALIRAATITVDENSDEQVDVAFESYLT